MLATVHTDDDLACFCRLRCPSALTVDDVKRHAPDASWILQTADGAAAARCSLWWTDTPAEQPHDVWSQWRQVHPKTPVPNKLGFIGHFACQDSQSAHEILTHALHELATHDCTTAIGPLDGNTWHRYRLLTERGSEPLFLLEPDNPNEWPRFWTDAGFAPLATYCSALNTNLAQTDPRLPQIAGRLTADDVQLRHVHMDRFVDELRELHRLSLVSFRDNFLYAPISEADFLAQYHGAQAMLRPELVLVAEHDARPIGFLFALPDLLQAKRGQTIDTVILKTLAVHPDFGGRGLGTLLMARVHEAARALGFRRAIHALFHEANRSGKISRHTAVVIRRYTLFAKSIIPPVSP